MCGENLIDVDLLDSETGSSPRVRGKPVAEQAKEGDNRLIPACAGKTDDAMRALLHLRAHPRVCGENARPAGFTVPTVGSSPRVRGKPLILRTCPAPVGLIPACAGKTKVSAQGDEILGAHPRVCGENLHALFPCRNPRGSSPRVRGKRCRA